MTLSIKDYAQDLGAKARAASRHIAKADTGLKNQALNCIAEQLISQREQILSANQIDIDNGKNNDLSPPLLDRLALTAERFDSMVEGLKQVASLSDPIGEITDLKYMPSGIQVGQMRVPLGVVGIIYESRPNVTVEAASLCLKSGNAVILRGGSEAINSNQAIAECIQCLAARPGPGLV